MESMWRKKMIQIFDCFNRMKKGMGDTRQTLEAERHIEDRKKKFQREARTRLLRLKNTVFI